MKRLRLVVAGTASTNPYAGLAWMHMQIAVGLKRLGHDVLYVEAASNWPYDPVRQGPVADSNYALPYLERVVNSFGLGEQWAYRRSFGDKEWLGPARSHAEEMLCSADAVINVSGGNRSCGT
jgi:hypothetical protein